MQHERDAAIGAQIVHQVKDDHGDDGDAAPAIDLPDARAHGRSLGRVRRAGNFLHHWPDRARLVKTLRI